MSGMCIRGMLYDHNYARLSICERHLVYLSEHEQN